MEERMATDPVTSSESRERISIDQLARGGDRLHRNCRRRLRRARRSERGRYRFAIGYRMNRAAGGPVPESDNPPAGGVVVGVPTMLAALKATGATTGWAGPSLVSPPRDYAP
jgi:hypothetical protein